MKKMCSFLISNFVGVPPNSKGMLCVHFYEFGIKVRLWQSAWHAWLPVVCEKCRYKN